MPKKSKNRSPSSLNQIGIETPQGMIQKIVQKYKLKELQLSPPVTTKVKPLMNFDLGISCHRDNNKSRKVCKTRSRARELFLNRNGCENPVRKSQVGKGAYGKVFKTCCRKDCAFVTKYINFNDKYSPSDFYREVYCQQLAAQAGIAPLILESYVTKSNGVIIMEQLDGPRLYDVHRELMKIKDPIKRRQAAQKLAKDIGKLFQKLHKAGLYHGDAHDNNILRDRKGNWRIIDYGRAAELGHNLKNDLKYLKNDYNYTFFYFEKCVPSFESNEWSYIRNYYKALNEYMIKDLENYMRQPYVSKHKT